MCWNYPDSKPAQRPVYLPKKDVILACQCHLFGHCTNPFHHTTTYSGELLLLALGITSPRLAAIIATCALSNILYLPPPLQGWLPLLSGIIDMIYMTVGKKYPSEELISEHHLCDAIGNKYVVNEHTATASNFVISERLGRTTTWCQSQKVSYFDVKLTPTSASERLM